MAEINKSGNITISDKFLYIEPNDKFGADKNSPVPLEDLSVYVDLRVDYQPQRHMTGTTEEGEEIYLRVALGGDGKKNVFLGGTKIGKKGRKSNFLTTVGYGNYTKLRIPTPGTNELFGVESIDIAYNSYMVPEVNIKFVDIKGAALHGAEELAHNSDGEYDQGAEENIENNYSRKFLSSFFTVPFPRFEMVVKGFYGDPVHYDLMCADFRSAFDSKTGNYTATVKMVGYSFALISDVQMCSLLAAPYSHYVGADYWKTRQNDGTFVLDGTPMPTLQEIVATWYNKMEEINAMEEGHDEETMQSELNGLQHQISNLNYGIAKIGQYITYLIELRADCAEIYFDEENKFIFVISSIEYKYLETIERTSMITFNSDGTVTEERVYNKNWGENSKRNAYVDDLKSILGDGYFAWDKIRNWEFHHYKGGETHAKRVQFLKNILHNKGLSQLTTIAESLCDSIYANKKETIEMFVYTLSFQDIIQKMTTEMENAYVEYANKQVDAEEELNQKLANIFQFKPTIENFSKICFAHLETFLYMFERVKQSELSNNDDSVTIEGKTYNNLFRVFPEYRKRVLSNGSSKLEEAYIAEILPEKTEIQFVRGLLKGIKDGVQSNNILPIGAKKADLAFNCISPSDVIRGTNPFLECKDGVLTKEFITNRVAELFGIGIQRISAQAKEMGKLDAQNYYMLYPSGYDNLASDIIEKKWSKLLFPYSGSVLKTRESNEFYNKVNASTGGWTSLSNARCLNEEIRGLVYNDTNCKLFKIIDDGSLDGLYFHTWSKGTNGTYTIDTRTGWSAKEIDSCFRFKRYINNLTAYIVPRVINRNDLESVPHASIWQDAESLSGFSYSCNIFNDYQYKEGDVVKYNIQRLPSENDKFINVHYDQANGYEYMSKSGNTNSESGVLEKILEISKSFQTVACNQYMTEQEYTILTIPGYDSYDFNINSGTLFEQNIYRNEKNLYVRAALFLHSFTWGRQCAEGNNSVAPEDIWESDEDKRMRENRTQGNDCKNMKILERLIARTINSNKHSKIDNDFQYIEVLPLFFVLKIGAVLYCYKNNIMNSGVYANFRMDGEFTTNLKGVYKDYLISYFQNWVLKTYKKWDEVFMAEPVVPMGVVSNLSSKLYYLSICNENFLANTPVRLFRQDHWVVNEMTKQFFKLVVLYKYNPVMLERTAKHSRLAIEHMLNIISNPYQETMVNLDYNQTYPVLVFHPDLQDYMDGFAEGLEHAFQDKVELKVNKTLFKKTGEEYIEFNLYRYLSQIWNRWIVSEKNDYNNWKMTKVFDEFNNRIHFIDSSYNKVGNILSVNIAKFCELVQSCKEQEDLPFLTFLSYFYRDNNCILYNIQNFFDSQDATKVQRIFDPVPFTEVRWDKLKPFSDLIVMFSYRPAENEEDSFNINDDLPWKLPEHLQQLIEGNYRIPAIGVCYGTQNQNYFIDIDVSMKTPTVTDQSLQATFQIADENSKGGASDSRLRVNSFGQDSWQVFSNHAYECTVKMMGCAWIQPLMYFQLMNVPLFRGAYIIQKVNHTIQAGQMFTTFSGMRISRKAFNIMERTQFVGQKNLIQQMYDLNEIENVSVSNDCPYVFYNPYGEDDTSDARHKVDFDMFMGMDVEIQNEAETESETFTNYQLFSIMFYKTGMLLSTDKSSLFSQFLIVLFYNFYKRFRDEFLGSVDDLFETFVSTYQRLLFNPFMPVNFAETIRFYEAEKNKINLGINQIKSMFNNPEKWVNEWASKVDDVNTIDGLVDKTLDTQGVAIKVYEIDSYKFTKGTYGDVRHYYGENAESGEESSITIQKIVESFNNTLTHVTLMRGNKIKVHKEYHSDDVHRALLILEKETDSLEVYACAYDMILQTYSDYLRGVVWIVKDKDSSSEMWKYIGIELATNNEFDAKVGYLTSEATILSETIDSYDVLNRHFYTSIMKKYSITKRFEYQNFKEVDDEFKTQCKNFNALNSEENWKEKVLDFFNTNAETKNITITTCNINDQYDVEVDLDNLLEFYDTGYYVSEERVNKYDGFQFEGHSGDTHTFHPGLMEQLLYPSSSKTRAVQNDDEDMELFLMRNGLVAQNNVETEEKNTTHGSDEMEERMRSFGEYTKSKIVDSSGACARYVREALEGCLKFNTEGRPDSASRYVHMLSFWGFSIIYEGMTSEFKGEYKNGDIIVTAGLDLPEVDENGKDIIHHHNSKGKPVTNRHMRIGHIQVYYNGKWYADKEFNSANVYASGGDRPSFIFRGMDTRNMTQDGNGNQNFGLNKKNGKVYWGKEYIYDEDSGGINWYPSDNVLEEIKKFEGWHGGTEGDNKKPGWVLCPAGYPTTGWGFIETPELRSKYPNGMTESEADEYYKDVAVPERVRQLKGIMRDMMYYNNSQMDGLFDLLYNVGSGVFKDKSPNMMSCLKSRNVQGVIRNMDHGLKSGLAGLRRRREYDRNLFGTNLGENG